MNKLPLVFVSGRLGASYALFYSFSHDWLSWFSLVE